MLPLAAVLLIRRGRADVRALTFGTLAVLAEYGAIFLFTNWSDVALHIEQAFPRLLAHIAPVAAVSVLTIFTGASAADLEADAPGA